MGRRSNSIGSQRYSYTSYNWDNAIIEDFIEHEHTSTATILNWQKLYNSSKANTEPTDVAMLQKTGKQNWKKKIIQS